MIDLNAIKTRCAQATGGPWAFDHGTHQEGGACMYRSDLNGPPEDRVFGVHSYRDADIQFVLHARADVPLLVKEVERLQAENEQLKCAYRVMASRAGEQAY